MGDRRNKDLSRSARGRKEGGQSRDPRDAGKPWDTGGSDDDNDDDHDGPGGGEESHASGQSTTWVGDLGQRTGWIKS